MSRDISPALAGAIDNCAREPIRTPGSVQPHGFLLVLDAEGVVSLASENACQWLGCDAPPLGATLDSLLSGRALSAALATLVDREDPTYFGETCLLGSGEQVFDVLAHRRGGRLFVEFEPAQLDSGGSYAVYPLVRTFVAQLQQAGSTTRLCQLAVEELKRISGFGRVMAYCFDSEGNGTVLAESRDEGYPSYLGQCFPGSDIPPQARELYSSNRIRLIADANYQPSPILGMQGAVADLDLSFCSLRSVSPVHLQYMRNMGTLASLSLSIMVDGRLWGLVSCHHASPRRLSISQRLSCDMLGRMLSLQIESREAHGETERLLGLRRQIVQMLSAMADRDSVSDGLMAMPEVFLSFARAGGAAIVTAQRCELLGDTPSRSQVMALVAWLEMQRGRELFHTDNMGRDAPEVRLGQRHAGVLAVAISELHSHYLIWFRPERVHTIEWAGEPNKQVDEQGVLSPRNSFAVWRETVSGFSLPWDRLELESALELRGAVLGIVLRKAEEMAQLTDQLTKSNKELEAFSYSVSHDLRAPLRHIAGYAELLGEYENERLSERGQRFLEHIGESARFAGVLVDNLLSFSQMGRAALRLSEVNLHALVESIQREMAPDLVGRDLQWHIGELPMVYADAAFLHLALRNLLSNAVKYSRDSAPALIEVFAELTEDETIVHIRDNGVGFDMQYVPKLFGVFQRLHRMEEFEGTGIGLASVRRIIERHDGRVWAEGRPNQGATFSFALPRKSASTHES